MTTRLPRCARTINVHKTHFVVPLILLLVGLWGCGQAPVAEAGAASSQCVPNQCQISGSLRADGTCAYTNKADGTGCDDNNSCTLFDTCKAGACTAGTILNDGATCDDKNVCTQTDICLKGVCVGTNPLVCPQGDACHEGGICDPVKGCTLKSYGPCVVGLGALGVNGCVQSSYFSPVTLGGQSFTMLLDSGSTTSAVVTAQCANCLVTPDYTPGAAATDQMHTAQAAYVDGTGWQGEVYMDTLVAGSAQTSLSPSVSMRFAAITQDLDPNNPFFTGSTCGSSFNLDAYQGILGLGPSDLALNYTDGFLDKVAATGKLIYDAFAVNLCDVGGQMWFGGFDPAAVAQAPNFTPMITKTDAANYYAIALDDLLVGSTSVGLSSDALGPTVIDTGTSPFVMTQATYAATVALLASNANFLQHFPKTFFGDGRCVASLLGSDAPTVASALPSLTLAMPSGGTVGGMQVTLSATKSYLQPQQSGASVVFCSTLASGTQALWGSAFMRDHVVIFDRENEQIGFAPQTTCGATLPYHPSSG